MHEIHRELNDLAVSSGRALQSKETGFVHSFYGKTEAPHQAISVEDNLLFALSLCRLKTMDGVQEGKGLLEKILAYQSAQGFFPTYLHEFPFCYDRHNGATFLPVLKAIYHHFHHVFGSEMSEKLKVAIDRLYTATLAELPQMALQNRIRLGQDDVEKLLQHPSRFNPKHLGEALSGAEGESANRLFSWMKGLWHSKFCGYAGPFESIRFCKGQPSITLYDLYMAADDGVIPSRFCRSNLLKAALLFPNDLKATEVDIPFMKIGPNSSFSWTGTNYPFAFQWGDAEHPAHLILSTDQKVTFDHSSLQIEMGTCPPFDSKESGREIFWYLSPTPGMQILVNGQASTTFKTGDLISIEDTYVKLQLVFQAKEGRFMGHLSKASAPTEMENFGQNRFEAYQWQLLWRTISRPEPCRITIHFSYAEKN